TREMHHTAEYGIAAHWLFKEGRKSPDELDRHLAWFRQLLELQQDAHTPEEFLEFLKVDLYQDEIFVFTPRGDVKRLPKGATALDAERLERAAAALSVGTAEQLQAALGRGDLALGTLMRALYPDLPADDLQAPRPTAFGRVIERLRLGRGIKIQGVDGLMVRYAQCCQPVPGDPVVGYVTQGRGISIHRSDCPNLLVLSAEAERRVEIDWQESEGETFV